MRGRDGYDSAAGAAALAVLLLFGSVLVCGCAAEHRYSDIEPDCFDGFVVDIRETQETVYLTVSDGEATHTFDCRYFLANSSDGDEVLGRLGEGSRVSVLYYGRLNAGKENYAEIVRESNPPPWSRIRLIACAAVDSHSCRAHAAAVRKKSQFGQFRRAGRTVLKYGPGVSTVNSIASASMDATVPWKETTFVRSPAIVVRGPLHVADLVAVILPLR